MAGFAPTGASSGSVTTDLQSKSPQQISLALTLAGTEYTLSLPANTTQYMLKTRSGAAFELRLAAASVDYTLIPRYCSVNQSLVVRASGLSLFITGTQAGDTLEAFVWTTP